MQILSTIRFFLLIPFAIIVLSFAPVSASAGPTDPLPTAGLDELPIGATCKALTVVEGTAIDSLDVKILGINVGLVGSFESDAALISFQLTEAGYEQIGVASGMSGSPILCNISGEDKVVGAIAYGYANVTQRGYATPIEFMLAPEGTAPVANASVFVGEQGLEPLVSSLVVGGIAPANQARFRAGLRQRGVEVRFVAGASANPLSGNDPALAPGGAFSMNLSSGAIRIGAICTITYRSGSNWWGCGHPFAGNGVTSLPVSGAEVFEIAGESVGTGSFKVAAPTATNIGKMSWDGPFAVSGNFDRAAANTFPITATLRAEGITRTRQTQVTDLSQIPLGNPLVDFGIPGWSEYAGATLFAAQPYSSPFKRRVHGRVCVAQRLLGSPVQFNGCLRFAETGGNGLAAGLNAYSSRIQEIVDRAEFASVALGAAEINVTLDSGANPLRRLIRVIPLNRARAGSLLRLRIVSADSDNKLHREFIRIKIPLDKNVAGKEKALLLSTSTASGGEELPIESGSAGPNYADSSAPPQTETYPEPSYSNKELLDQLRLFSGMNQRQKLLVNIDGLRKPISVPIGSTNLYSGAAEAKLSIAPARPQRTR